MSRRIVHQSEWIFIAVLAVLCAVLTAVQYRWTGELARTEAERLTNDFKTQAQQIAGDFDAELERSCEALVPSERDLRDLGLTKAHALAWQQWQALSPRPMFARIAVVEVADRSLVYHEQDLKTGAMKPASWPTDWAPLRQNLEDKLNFGSQPFEDPWGLVFEVPVFQRGREAEWVIFELDEKYLAQSWMPELLKQRLTLNGQLLGAVRVSAAAEPSKVLFQSGDLAGNARSAPIRFNQRGRSVFESRMASSKPPGDAPPNRGGPDAPGGSAWMLEAQRTPAVLEELVGASRRRNLGIAMALNFLILTAGIMLVRHTRKSRELAQQQMDFVATVSHELRTPLTVIKGAAHNLQHGVVSDPERVSRYLELIAKNTDNLTDMVEQVLAQAGAQRAGAMRHEPLNVGDVLREALANCEAETQASGCEVETHIATDLPNIKGDVQALRRVFQNLISNAAKHAASGQWIGIDATMREGGIEVRVTDRGPGIPAREQRTVFDPFVRGAAAQEAQTRGSGLGLSLVKDLVEAHGGSVMLNSEPGSGCTFTIKLPIS